MVLTETGPMLVLTSRPSIHDGRVLDTLSRRGVVKFIAHEVPVDAVQRVYGRPFEVVAAELESGVAMRILDLDGPHVLASLPLARLGRPIMH
jgi:hypothetical protein